MICYLVMGWCIIFRINVIINSLGTVGFSLLLAGGIVYTVGAIFYGLGKKRKWLHSIFHLGCVIRKLVTITLCINICSIKKVAKQRLFTIYIMDIFYIKQLL
jgi:hemolysin III